MCELVGRLGKVKAINVLVTTSVLFDRLNTPESHFVGILELGGYRKQLHGLSGQINKNVSLSF